MERAARTRGRDRGVSDTQDLTPFDLAAALPAGVTVLEASAGTGKTYTIAALAARYVAEGTPLQNMLLVTFTRMATGELRERVRERLVGAELALEHTLSGGSGDVEEDAVSALLATGAHEELELRRRRLARAVADFDAATIATTHGFCQEVLGGLGIAGDLEDNVTFEEDIDDLLAEIVDDLYVRRFYRHGGPVFDRAEAMRIAEVTVRNPRTRIEPEAAGEHTIAAMRRRLAHAVLDELEARKRRMAVMTYDDLLTRLDDTLKGPGGDAAAARLRARYAVVLVDEFQDTDPVQWSVVRRAFGEAPTTLVLIGDPKQAIYAFRGADVYAYLDAASLAGTRATLEINWRSDAGLIRAYDVMFAGAKLGHEGIVYRTVRAAKANQTARLSDAPVRAPLRIRVVRRDEPSVSVTRNGYVSSGSAREHIAEDLARDVVRLLSSDALVERRTGGPAGWERVRPGDIAVLVRTHRNAELIHDALDEVHVPGVINGAGSVFGSVSAEDWLCLLEALERPTSAPRAHSVALTPLFGWNAEHVACASENEWEEVHRRLHHWARVLRVMGVAALVETISLAEQMPGRVLTIVGGERRLTDLRHLAQLLHEATTLEQLGTGALTTWLRQRIFRAEQETGDEDRSRRLESDAEAVQVLTIHRSKGLEFPVVYCPYLWERGYIPPGEQPVFFHDPDAQDARTIDVGLEGQAFARHQRQHLIEQRGEDLRLAYVALTRAQHQAVVWWAGSFESRDSPLGRLLFARDADGNIAAEGTFTPSDQAATDRFDALATEADGNISVERSRLGPELSFAAPASADPELSGAVFDRQLDTRWRRTSYSDITAESYEARVASEPEAVDVSDEPPAPTGAQPAAERPPETAVGACLLASMPVGVRIGTFVHQVLQDTDFAAARLDDELEGQITATLARRELDIGDRAAVVAGLRAAIETPLVPLFGDVRLRDLSLADRLDELQFELPLVGGETPTGRLTLTAIGNTIRAHTAPDDPLFGYAERLREPALRQSVRGYLTGTIDVVARVAQNRGEPRFAVLDYKTNWLGSLDDELSAWHYRPAALAGEMQQAHYALQGLLYTVALHRYLRWRLPGYDAERNLAGVFYLFLRGMIGAETPVIDGGRCGVFAWQPSKALVEALSDVLDAGAGS
jgi:exodeoxyribonuclease V beta subunit